MKKVARHRGAYLIFVQAEYGDEPPIGVYSRFGDAEHALNFDIKVG